MKRHIWLIALVALIAAACGGTDDASSTTAAAGQTTVASEPGDGPAMGPAEVVFEGQASDGNSITIASVTLPAAGFIAVHADADGGPGDVIGHSELLQAGTTENVVVTFDAPLAQSEVVWPMAHIDVDEDGVYTFVPPDNVVDGPATFADGSVAVVSGEVTVGS